MSTSILQDGAHSDIEDVKENIWEILFVEILQWFGKYLEEQDRTLKEHRRCCRKKWEDVVAMRALFEHLN